MTPAPVIVIGQGNEYRGDDGAGPAVIRRLTADAINLSRRIRLISGPLDMAEIIEAWDSTELTIFVDAVISKSPAGTIYRFKPLITPIPEDQGIQFSTHDSPPVTQALELGRALNRLPGDLEIYCIEGQDLAMKIGLSPAVEKAVEQVAGDISKRLESIL